MSNIVPLAPGAVLPSYLAARKGIASLINQDVTTHGQGYPTLSIKGKVFTLIKDNERRVMTREDDPDEVLQFVTLTVLRANTKNRTFYAKAFEEGTEGEASRPDCYSNDSIAPAGDARNPQASKCQVCPHAVWGSKPSRPGVESKGTACSVVTTLSIVDPEHLNVEKIEPILLRVPAASRSNFADVVKTATARNIDYNMLALKVGFDKEVATPKLTFKIVGLISDAAYAKVSALYEDSDVKAMLGLGAQPAAPAAVPALAHSATEDDLEAALNARAVEAAEAAFAKASAPAPKPVAKAAPKPVAKPAVVQADEADLDAALAPAVAVAAPAPAAAKAKPAAKPAPADEDVDDLMSGLDALLSATDD